LFCACQCFLGGISYFPAVGVAFSRYSWQLRGSERCVPAGGRHRADTSSLGTSVPATRARLPQKHSLLWKRTPVLGKQKASLKSWVWLLLNWCEQPSGIWNQIAVEGKKIREAPAARYEGARWRIQSRTPELSVWWLVSVFWLSTDVILVSFHGWSCCDEQSNLQCALQNCQSIWSQNRWKRLHNRQPLPKKTLNSLESPTGIRGAHAMRRIPVHTF